MDTCACNHSACRVCRDRREIERFEKQVLSAAERLEDARLRLRSLQAETESAAAELALANDGLERARERQDREAKERRYENG